MDFCPDESVVREVEENPYLIVLRTFTHFYALSGLRIGYGIFPKKLISVIREQKEPWTVNSLAQRAGVIGLKDKVYRRETFKLLEHEKQVLEKAFKRLGITFIPSAVNFYLLRVDNAEAITKKLTSKGILVRECSDFKGLDNTYLRVAVKSHKDNAILIKELTAMLQK
jgi:threonine-phosphate decarboxylase